MPYVQRSVEERQGLAEIFGGAVGDDAAASAPVAPINAATQSPVADDGGIGDFLSSIVNPGQSSSSTTATSATSISSTTSSSSSSSSSSTSSSSSAVSSSSSSVVSSSSSTATSALTSSSSATTTGSSSSTGPSSSSSVATITHNGSTTVVTVITSAPTSSTPAIGTGSPQNDAAISNPSFLQNKPLVGGVFAVVGIVAAIVLVLIATWSLRRRRRKSLEDEIVEAVSWQPHRHSHHSFADDVNRDASNYGGEKGDWRSETGSMTQGYGAPSYGGQVAAPPSTLYNQPLQQQAAYGQPQPYPFSTPNAVQQYQAGGAHVQQQPLYGSGSNAAAQAAAALALPSRFNQGNNGLGRSGTLGRTNETTGNPAVTNE